LVIDSSSILGRWRNHFSQLLNVLVVNDVRQTEIHTAEPLVPEPGAFKIETAIEKAKRHKSPGYDQIPAVLIKAGVEKLASRSINIFILLGIRRDCLRSGRNRSLYLFTRRAIKETVVIIETYHFCQLRTKCYPKSCCQG